MNRRKVFVDSDVVLSSLLSSKGAARFLLYKQRSKSIIVAGAKKAKAKVILLYNLRDFNRQKISDDLGAAVLTPAQYLQYLRSLK